MTAKRGVYFNVVMNFGEGYNTRGVKNILKTLSSTLFYQISGPLFAMGTIYNDVGYSYSRGAQVWAWAKRSGKSSLSPERLRGKGGSFVVVLQMLLKNSNCCSFIQTLDFKDTPYTCPTKKLVAFFQTTFYEKNIKPIFKRTLPLSC